MEKTPTPTKSFADIERDCICASIEWVDLSQRVARTGERDAQLKARRDAAMDGFCREGGLLDQYVVIKELEFGNERAIV